MRELKILTRLELCNLFGINVIRMTKDKAYKKKAGIFAVIILFLLAVALSYIVALCAGLSMLGAARIIPAYLIAIASFLILFFDVFKIGGVIFRKKGYDMMASLPVSDGAVVTSRFIRMYVESLLVALLIFVPGLFVYAVVQSPGMSFYLLAVWIVMVIPLLPLALATFAGTLITGIASRMKHKSIVEAVLSLLLVTGVLGLSMKLPGTQEEMSLDMLRNLSETATEAIQNIYPPAILMGKAMTGAGVKEYLLFTAISVAIVSLVMWIAAGCYQAIMHALYTSASTHNYKIRNMKQTGVQKALIVREARRYFASGPYVSNTIIGPAMGAVASVALLFADIDLELAQFSQQMPVPMNMKGAIPLMMAALMTMMNAVCMSVSMEGKEWWIAKTLPLSTRSILDAKLCFNLLLIAPFFIVSQIALWVALKPGVVGAVVTLWFSAMIIVFSCVFGLRINLLFPKMDWENETVAVKQSASSFLGGIGGVLATLLLVVPVLLVPEKYYIILCIAESFVLIAITYILYQKNNAVLLEEIA